MNRKGRDLEKIVAHFEQLIDNKDMKITSPDYIVGKNSKSSREIDITLRKSVGSTDVLIMIECRDRPSSDSEGVDWLEQIVTKKVDIGASKAVVVSTTPFTSGAIQTATSYDIDLRYINEIKPEDIDLWFAMKHITMMTRKFHPIYVQVVFPKTKENENIKLLESKLNVNTKFLKRTDNQLLSITDVISTNNDAIYKDIGDDQKVRKNIHIKFDQPIYVNSNFGWHEIEKVVIDIELWIEATINPLNSIKEYNREDGQNLGQTAEFEIEISGKKVIFALNKVSRSGQQNITLRLKNE